MFHNRFQPAHPARPIVDPTPSPAAFQLYPVVCCPVAFFTPGHWQHDLYAWALEQAKAVARPSLPERDLLAVWN